MSKPNILIIVGSLRGASINRRLGKALALLAADRARVSWAELGPLPLYNQDEDGRPSAAVSAFREQVRQADGVLFITPEYNRSIPGVLKNAIDIGSRPYGQSVWAGKAGAVCGASPGATGTAMAQQHLRNVLSHLDMDLVRQPEVFLKLDEGLITEDGQITNPSTAKFLDGFLGKLLDLVQRTRA